MEGEVLKELLVRQREEAGQYEGLNQFLEDYLLSRDKYIGLDLGLVLAVL